MVHAVPRDAAGHFPRSALSLSHSSGRSLRFVTVAGTVARTERRGSGAQPVRPRVRAAFTASWRSM